MVSPPLSSTGRFADLIPDSAESMPGLRVEHLPEDLGRNAKGPIVFEAKTFVASTGELKGVHISSGKIEIVNLFFFPAPALALPVYALEFVTFGKRAVVGVIDLKPLCAVDNCHAFWRTTLEHAHRRFPSLQQGDDPPDWYLEARSGLDFFVRPDGDAALSNLDACHRWIWQEYCQAASSAGHLSETEAHTHAGAIDDYRDHHRINSPGLPFLNRTFGADWTDRFLRQVLFAHTRPVTASAR